MGIQIPYQMRSEGATKSFPTTCKEYQGIYSWEVRPTFCVQKETNIYRLYNIQITDTQLQDIAGLFDRYLVCNALTFMNLGGHMFFLRATPMVEETESQVRNFCNISVKREIPSVRHLC